MASAYIIAMVFWEPHVVQPMSTIMRIDFPIAQCVYMLSFETHVMVAVTIPIFEFYSFIITFVILLTNGDLTMFYKVEH